MSENVRHTCNPRNPGKPLPFGKRDPKGECPRCKQLDDGAEPRTLGWVEAKERRESNDARQARELQAHFASVKHRSGGCGVVCTFGDW